VGDLSLSVGNVILTLESSGGLSKGLKQTLAATGSLAMALAGSAGAKAAAPDQPKVDPGRWADAFDSWSVGFGAGYGFFGAPTTIDSFNTYSGPVSTTLNSNGPVASFELGKDFRINNSVFGVYGDFHVGDRTSAFASSDSYAPAAGLTLGEGGSLTARAGFVPNQRTLFYGLFGWSWQQYASSVSGTSSSYSSIGGSGSGVLNGPTIGFGAEMLFPNHPNVSFKSEYRFTHFDAPSPISPDGGADFIRFGNVDDQTVRFILSFKLPQ